MNSHQSPETPDTNEGTVLIPNHNSKSQGPVSFTNAMTMVGTGAGALAGSALGVYAAYVYVFAHQGDNPNENYKNGFGFGLTGAEIGWAIAIFFGTVTASTVGAAGTGFLAGYGATKLYQFFTQRNTQTAPEVAEYTQNNSL